MGEPSPASTLQPVEARPPTPPRGSERTNLRSSLLERVAFKGSRRPSRSSHLTPESLLDPANNTSGSLRKRVGWAASADYSELPATSSDGEGPSRSLQFVPSSAARKPLKSILKAYNAPLEYDYTTGNGTKLLPPHQHTNFAKMLESAVQFLAGNDRQTKIETYIMLSSSLKASSDVPDVEALKGQMPLICSFMSRDLTSKMETTKIDTGVVLKPDSVLIVNALTLLASLMQKPIVAESFPLEFQANFVEHTIKVFTDKSITKEIVRHLMFLMGQQGFSPKVMNKDRVVRLISVLHTLEHQVKGKSVVTGRLQVYRNLLRRSKGHMLANTEWMQDLFVDMRSSSKDIHNSAITFGLEASLLLGTESGATRALTKLFDMEHSDGNSFADFYASGLKATVKKREEASSTVPQIWSVVILFLRANPALYEKWRFMKLFMDVMSDCLNTGDSMTKCEANYAWNRYIFARQLSESTLPTVRDRLFQPLLSQIRERRSKGARKSALNSFYHLLYYAFSPNSTTTRLDIYWDEYVKLLMTALIADNVRGTTEIAKSDIDEACTILCCLFDTSRQRPWNENRVFENLQQNTMNVKELPALDAKWLRGRVSRVTPILSTLLEKVFWELGADDSPITKLLEAYLRTIALPAKMEIKVSNDTMSCIASIFGIIHKIWTVGRMKIASLPQSKGPHGPNTSAAFLRCFEKIIMTTIESLGLLPFSEKLLSISQNTFIAVATPSQQPKKIRGEIKCPLNHLVLFLMTISPDLEYDQGFLGMVHRILDPFFQPRKSSLSKREFVRDLFNLLPLEPTPPSVLVWQVLADFASLATDFRDEKEASKLSEQPLGANYRETIKILEAGHRYSASAPPVNWKLLFEALVTSSSLDAGDAGKAVAVIEPLANVLIPKNKDACSIGYLHVLLAKASYPKDRQALDIARKRMWGTTYSSQKSSAFDPYIFLYEYIQVSLESSYESFSKQNNAMYTDVVVALSGLLARCPEPLLLGALIKLQSGVVNWIVDPDSYLVIGSALFQAVIDLWTIMSNSVARISQSHKYTKLLNDLETLICCGLESKHNKIVTLSVQLWNSTFGSSKEHLQYPDRVKAALTTLYPVADLLLPYFPDSLEKEVSANQAQRVEFAETQNDSIYPGISSTDSFLKLRPSYASEEQISPTTRRLRQTTPQVIISSSRSSSSKKRPLEGTPSSSRPKKKKDTTPKARHDDSQVQFEAVQSSPIADRMGESQLLTEKQKDTRERQLTEAGMFRDLRSSPRVQEKKADVAATEDPKLPQHRSISRSRSRSQSRPAEIPRPTTPTLVPPSDDDHFVTSSPTPTRSVRDTADNQEMPSSSPPKSVTKKRSNRGRIAEVETNLAMIDSIVSSAAAQSVIETNQSSLAVSKSAAQAGEGRSLTPSAQVNPFAFPVSLVSSPWVSTGGVRSSSPDPSAQLLADASQQHDGSSDQEDRLQELPRTVNKTPTRSPSMYPTLISTIENPRFTGTPAKNFQKSPLGQRTLQTPSVVDRLPNLPSSDANEISDIFEDAVSSPRSYIEKNKETNTPSSPSDGEERSMLRIMDGFDLVHGQNKKLAKKAQVEVDGQIQVPVTSSTELVSSAQGPVINKGTALLQVQISSDSSRVPETPGVPTGDTRTYFDSDGDQVDMSQTIIVDDAGMELERFNFRRRSGRPAKKRKHQELEDSSHEVPDSQEGGRELEASKLPQKQSPAKRGPPTIMTRRSFSRQSSQVSLASEASFELQASQDLSLAATALVAETEKDTTQHRIASPVKQLVIVDSHSPIITNNEVHSTSSAPVVLQTQSTRSSIRAPIASTSPAKVNDATSFPQPTRSSSQLLRATTAGMKIVATPLAKAILSVGANMGLSQDTHNPSALDRGSVHDAPIAVEKLRDIPEHLINDTGKDKNLDGGEEQRNLDPVTERQKATKYTHSKQVNEDTTLDVAMEQVRGDFLAPGARTNEEEQAQPETAAGIIENFRKACRGFYGKLPSFKLTRTTISAIEDDLMDIKSELYAAGARGRGLEEDEMVDEEHDDGVL